MFSQCSDNCGLKMENWRLSRIEVELGKVKLDLESPDVVSTLPEVSDDRKLSARAAETEKSTSAEDDLLSKIVIRPAYSKSSRRKGDATKAVQMIKEKYDSPNAVTKSGLNAEPSRPTPSGVGVTGEAAATGTWRPSDPDICRVESQPHGGQRLMLDAFTMGLQPVCDSFQGDTPVRREMSPPVVAAPCVAFDFNATVYHPPAAPKDSPPRPCSGPRSPSRPGPPTTAKPPSSLYLGQLTAQHRYDPTKQSPGDSYPYTGESVASVAAVQPPDLVMVQPFVPTDYPSPTSLPEPPSDVFLRGYLLPQPQQRTPSPTVDFQAMPPFSQMDESFLRAVPPQPGNEETFNSGDVLEGRIVDVTYPGLDYSYRKRSEPEQTTCEPVSMETHTIRHLADSYNCRPRFGTLKATRSTNPQRSGDPQSGDFFPPRGPCLTDEDRNQVEMFYRSHKTRLFVAKCEANLYFGSARRHSAVVPSRSAAARAAESPENWMFLKCGIPVLLLDSGESRRQRRLHIILAERGSGFVLWRDTFDHLTGYSVSPNVGFHTMHLSKDHTKLAGFYFADSLSATEFFDFLSNLTSDPDDPLLSLSNGTKKKKKDRKKTGCGATSRKEKRKPIRREDISLPCCFTHVTKLDRNDGLHILLSDDSLLQQKQNDSQVETTESS